MTDRAVAVIIKNKSLLLIHRQKPEKDYYVLPGGSIEDGETTEQACIREVREETGLEVLRLELLVTQENMGNKEYYYLAYTKPGEEVLGSPEFERITANNRYILEWVSSDRLSNINMLPETARKICFEALYNTDTISQ
jgi:ADP-ribose pyrophosphatase YjhB (NUDIX family)